MNAGTPPPRVAAVILAGGRSSRMGPSNKLLAGIAGRPMLRRVVDAALASRADPVLVVTGHEAERVRATVGDANVRIVHNPDFAAGLSTSLRAGVQSLPADAEGVVVCLGDMPNVTGGHIDALIAAFDPAGGRAVCVPTYRGRRGNPVLLGRRFFPDILALSGDAGARRLIEAHPDLVAEVAMPDAGVLTDVDTPEALAALTGTA